MLAREQDLARDREGFLRTVVAAMIVAIVSLAIIGCSSKSDSSSTSSVARHFAEAIASDLDSAGIYWRPDQMGAFQLYLTHLRSNNESFAGCEVSSVLASDVPEPGTPGWVKVIVSFAQPCGSDGAGHAYTTLIVTTISLSGHPYVLAAYGY